MLCFNSCTYISISACLHFCTFSWLISVLYRFLRCARDSLFLFFFITSDTCDHLVYVADLLCFAAFISSLSLSQFAYLLSVFLDIKLFIYWWFLLHNLISLLRTKISFKHSLVYLFKNSQLLDLFLIVYHMTYSVKRQEVKRKLKYLWLVFLLDRFTLVSHCLVVIWHRFHFHFLAAAEALGQCH